MNLSYKELLPSDFSSHSRVWIYQSNRLFSLSEALELEKVHLELEKENLELSFRNTDKSFLFYYLDLLKFRPVSNEVASTLNVHHQSPQLILIHDGQVVYTTSHHKIKATSIEESLSLLS
jgi:bacillithiol system protein YtxJ